MPAALHQTDLLARIERLQAEYRSSLAQANQSRQPRLVGLLCLSSPIELIEAAGAVPLRIMPATSEAELRGGRFLSSDSCSFCKSVLGGIDLGLLPLSAVLGATTCDQMRRNLEILARDLHLPVFVFNAPRTSQSQTSRQFARQEIERLRAELSAWAGMDIADPLIIEALRRRAGVRHRIKHLQAQRETEFPHLTGSEFLALMSLFQTTSLDFFISHLSDIETALEHRPEQFSRPPLRLALLGSCVGEGDDQILSLMEESGRAVVVYDALCTGHRALYGETNLPEDPLEALVILYHDQIHCPYRRPNDSLFDAVAEDLRRLGVQGVVYKTLKFCHPWGFEARRFKERLGLPFLHLDHDYSLSAQGQMRTRISAFLEQLSLKR